MTYPQYFDDQHFTREPSSFYPLDSGPGIDSYPIRLLQKDLSYPNSHYDVNLGQRPAHPRVLSDTPSLDAFFSEAPTFGVSGPGEHTATPKSFQRQHVPSGPGAEQIARSISAPEPATQSDRSAPSVSASQSGHSYRNVAPEAPETPCTPPAPLKKSSSAQATFPSQSQNDNGLSRQSSEHGSVQETSNQSNYVPSFPEPQHHHYHYAGHANSTPLPYVSQPIHDFSGSQRSYPQSGQARNGVDLGPRNPHTSFQHGPSEKGHPPRAGGVYQRQYSNGSLTARNIRPDMQSFEAMLQALQDFGACKEIFESMSKELDQINTNVRKGEFETGIIAETNALREASTEALQSAERLVKSYDGFARALDKRLADIANSHNGGGMLFPCEDIDVLSEEITLSASALTHHVEKMQDRVRGLLAMIDNLKDKRDRADQRRRIWKWLARALEIMSTVFTAGACVAPLFGPYGLIASAVMAGAAPLCAALSTLCKKQAESLTEEKKLDNFLIFLRENLLTEAKAAEINLTSFPPLQLVHRAALDARSDISRGWISAEEANRARVDWSEWFRRFDQERTAKQSSDRHARNVTLA